MTQRRPKRPGAVMASSKSADRSTEHDHRSPQSPSDVIRKTANEAGAEHGIVNKIEAVGRELDRNIGGEYERRDDQTPARVRADSRVDEAALGLVCVGDGTSVLVPRVSRAKWVVVALAVLICIIALLAFAALRASRSTNPVPGDRQYTISPIHPH